MSFASVAGHPVVAGSLMIPLVGLWTADLHLATDQVVTGSVTVVIGNLILQGAVYRSEPFAGQTRARLVGGFGGWRKTVSAQAYGSGSGVQLSTIVKDVALAVGESYTLADKSVGPAFVRLEGPASDVLWQLVALGSVPSWHIDPSGSAVLDAWPKTVVITPFTVVDQKPDEGLVIIATEDYAAWLPGCTFTDPNISGTLTCGGVTHVFTDDGHYRLEVLTTTSAEDRLAASINALIDRKLAPTRFFGRYSYTISNPTESTIDGTPNDKTLGLPEIQGAPLASDSIATYLPPGGGECHVMFVDGNPTKPRCVWTEGQPTQAEILGGPTPIARIGDTTQTMVTGLGTALATCLFQFVGPTGVGGSMLVGSPYTLAPVSVFQITTACSGTITTGSQKVKSQ